MLFNSWQFALFFPVVTILYFVLAHRYRWSMLLAASCVFYIVFVPAYILILALTIGVDYWAAIRIEQSTGRRRRDYLILSIVSTCAILFVFKYFNFFNSSVATVAHAIGWRYPSGALDLLLPIGLSFHTFQSLSYVIEVYRGNYRAERHFGIYSLYVMFYPQLVAGPIERPQNLLHQFREYHPFDAQRVASGLQLMSWGFFKKVVIADRIAPLVSSVFDAPHAYPGLPSVTATVLFAFQIYCDFSGYSDIAIGSAEVMGFKLMRNFNRPYFATSIAEFWRRWHISLSTWFRDYVYIPLGGSRVGRLKQYRNALVTFVISGLWHGAAWTYVFWGFYHGMALVFGRIVGRGEGPKPEGMAGLRILRTFIIVSIGWVFFRARSLADGAYMLRHGVSDGMRQISDAASGVPVDVRHVLWLDHRPFDVLLSCALIALLISIEAWQARAGSLRAQVREMPPALRWAVYYSVILGIALLGVFGRTPFIYFQF